MNLLYGKSGSCLLRQPCGRTMSGLTLDSRKLNSNGQCRERQNRNKKYREQYVFYNPHGITLTYKNKKKMPTFAV